MLAMNCMLKKEPRKEQNYCVSNVGIKNSDYLYFLRMETKLLHELSQFSFWKIYSFSMLVDLLYASKTSFYVQQTSFGVK